MSYCYMIGSNISFYGLADCKTDVSFHFREILQRGLGIVLSLCLSICLSVKNHTIPDGYLKFDDIPTIIAMIRCAKLSFRSARNFQPSTWNILANFLRGFYVKI